MRRSEMVNELIKTNGAYDSWKEQCEYMLETLEKAGMLPPIESWRKEEDLDLGVPEWDPEEEPMDVLVSEAQKLKLGYE